MASSKYCNIDMGSVGVVCCPSNAVTIGNLMSWWVSCTTALWLGGAADDLTEGVWSSPAKQRSHVWRV